MKPNDSLNEEWTTLISTSLFQALALALALLLISKGHGTAKTENEANAVAWTVMECPP
jgi:hypothetical protein